MVKKIDPRLHELRRVSQVEVSRNLELNFLTNLVVDGHGCELPLAVVGVGVHLQREGQALEGGVAGLHRLAQERGDIILGFDVTAKEVNSDITM